MELNLDSNNTTEIEVIKSDSPLNPDFNIPETLFTGLVDILEDQQLLLANKIAQEFNINIDDLINKCFPDQVQFNIDPPKKPQKPKKSMLTDYTQAKILEDLKVFKIAELKVILQENKLPTSGSKAVLMGKVWDILHKDLSPTDKTLDIE
uniref:SAP domain-containing protein n=1 Tax=viral metagenome TaxID=1070528 RepID=A0A6C0EL48_9ZZZZ